MTEYKVIHSADLQADLDHWAAEGWELYDSPQSWRQPNSPALWLVVMEREPKNPEAEANGVTLATIRGWAENDLFDIAPRTDHAKGYNRAVQDVRAILKVHGQPPGTPVRFGE